MQALFLGHLGLGDQIMLMGAIKHFSKEFDKLVVPCKPHSVGSVQLLIDQNNIKNVELLNLGEADRNTNGSVVDFKGKEVKRSWAQSNIGQYDRLAEEMSHNFSGEVIRSGVFNKKSWYRHFKGYKGSRLLKKTITVDRAFYRQLQLPIDLTFDIECSPGKMSDFVLDSLKPKEPYIFVQDDPGRGHSISLEYLPKGIRIIKPTIHTDSIFDYLPLMEGAEEVHLIDSCFACMWDRSPYVYNSENYIHRYVRFHYGNPYYRAGFWSYFGDPVCKECRR